MAFAAAPLCLCAPSCWILHRYAASGAQARPRSLELRAHHRVSSSLPRLASTPVVRASEATAAAAMASASAIERSVDPPISRREAVVQVLLSGAGRSLVATGIAAICASASGTDSPPAAAAAAAPAAFRAGAAGANSRPQFFDLEGSGGVKALDIREGTGGTPGVGDKVAIHYYARLAAKQGWRFDSSYEHKDQSGAPEPYVFVIGDGTVIAGLDSALLSMREGGVRRVIIPPSQGYQNTQQGPIPPNFSDRQRLYTTIFNPTRLANGEGSTLGTLVFDIELLGIRPN